MDDPQPRATRDLKITYKRKKFRNSRAGYDGNNPSQEQHIDSYPFADDKKKYIKGKSKEKVLPQPLIPQASEVGKELVPCLVPDVEEIHTGVAGFINKFNDSPLCKRIGRSIHYTPGLEGILLCQPKELCYDSIRNFWDNGAIKNKGSCFNTLINGINISVSKPKIRKWFLFPIYRKAKDNKKKKKKKKRCNSSKQWDVIVKESHDEFLEFRHIVRENILGGSGKEEFLLKMMRRIYLGLEFDWVDFIFMMIKRTFSKKAKRKKAKRKLGYEFVVQTILNKYEIKLIKPVKVSGMTFKDEKDDIKRPTIETPLKTSLANDDLVVQVSTSKQLSIPIHGEPKETSRNVEDEEEDDLKIIMEKREAIVKMGAQQTLATSGEHPTLPLQQQNTSMTSSIPEEQTQISTSLHNPNILVVSEKQVEKQFVEEGCITEEQHPGVGDTLPQTQASQVVNEKAATNHHSCAPQRGPTLSYHATNHHSCAPTNHHSCAPERGPTLSYHLCRNCSKNHEGICSIRGGCFNCGETGHTQNACPQGDTLPQKASKVAFDAQRMSTQKNAKYLPCDPKSLPKYESSHEFETKKKRPQQRENKDMAKRQKLPYPQRHTHLPPIQQSGEVHPPPQHQWMGPPPQHQWMGGSNLPVNNNPRPPYGKPLGHWAYHGSQPPQGRGGGGGAHHGSTLQYHGNVPSASAYGAPPDYYSSQSSQHGGGPPLSIYSSSAGFTHITVVHYSNGAYPPPNYSSQSSQHGGLGVGSGSGRGPLANRNQQYGGWQQ